MHSCKPCTTATFVEYATYRRYCDLMLCNQPMREFARMTPMGAETRMTMISTRYP